MNWELFGTDQVNSLRDVGEPVIRTGFPEPVAGNFRHVTEPRFRLAPAALALFQVVGHVVEGAREFAEFAAGREGSPDGKVSPAKPRGGLPHRVQPAQDQYLSGKRRSDHRSGRNEKQHGKAEHTLLVHLRQNHGAIDADRQPRAGPGQRNMGENSLHSLQVGQFGLAFGSFKHRLTSGCPAMDLPT